MDTSQIYIKMCVQAEEIQRAWKPQGGDYYLHNYRNTTGFSREVERQIWGDADEKWQTIEILCYKPMEDKDWFVSTADDQSHVTSVADLVRHNCIWLPRQDQLQAMVLGGTLNNDKLGSLLSRFWVFCSCFYNGELTFKVFSSMEQLWLGFVMKEKYDKVWIGEDWKTR